MPSALLSTLHLFGIAFGFPALFFRGRALWRLRTPPREEAARSLFLSDRVWGLASLHWLTTGLIRVFSTADKGSAYYFSNWVFLTKVGLFAFLAVLEAYPMVTFVRWRETGVEPSRLGLLFALNAAELVLIAVMPFLATMMARGIGM